MAKKMKANVPRIFNERRKKNKESVTEQKIVEIPLNARTKISDASNYIEMSGIHLFHRHFYSFVCICAVLILLMAKNKSELLPIVACCCNIVSFYYDYPSCVGCSGNFDCLFLSSDWRAFKMKEGKVSRLCYSKLQFKVEFN